MANAQKLTERVEIRVSREEKMLLTRAAAADFSDVTTFVKSTVLPAAEKKVAEAENLRLSARDVQKMLDLLQNPPKLTPALIAAAKSKYSAD